MRRRMRELSGNDDTTMEFGKKERRKRMSLEAIGTIGNTHHISLYVINQQPRMQQHDGHTVLFTVLTHLSVQL